MSKILPVSREPELTRKEVAEQVPYPEDSPTPSQMKESDCCYAGAPRPCPLVSCRFNNYLTVTEYGTILVTWPELQPEEVPPDDSCALDIARNRGYSAANPMPFSELKQLVGSTSRQNAKNLVDQAQSHARRIRRGLVAKDIENGNDDR